LNLFTFKVFTTSSAILVTLSASNISPKRMKHSSSLKTRCMPQLRTTFWTTRDSTLRI